MSSILHSFIDSTKTILIDNANVVFDLTVLAMVVCLALLGVSGAVKAALGVLAVLAVDILRERFGWHWG